MNAFYAGMKAALRAVSKKMGQALWWPHQPRAHCIPAKATHLPRQLFIAAHAATLTSE